ncbi:MAG TPA: sulfatase-like hydrolase/transferase, partial [Flavisolibacter sp.]|nr:sulfatase-like hydrolase/transferase [Flavisolibacter sp.]
GDTDFKREEVDAEELNEWGFESVEEYNAFRYFDHSIQHFMEAAKKESYFDNTVFVFIGDHGVSGNAKAVYPSVWTEERLTEEHVPLLFYAPQYLKPQKREEVVSQIDVLPTIAGLTGQTFTNTTLGRDVLNGKKLNDYAFTISHDEGRIGIITNDYFFTKNLNFQKEEIHFLHDGVSYTPQQVDSIKRKMTEVTTAFYETAKYMLVHNGKALVHSP